MSLAPFPTSPEQTSVALAFKNPRFIADDVLPRVPVGKQDFTYLRWDLAEGFSVPDTKVGRRSQPNEVEFSATEHTGRTIDYGLEDPIPQADIDNAPRNVNLLNLATERLTNIIALEREARVAGMVFNTASYAAGHTVTLAGNDQWSDTVNSDPIDDITTGLDKPILRPNTMVIGRQAFTKLCMHPKVVSTIFGSSTDAGMVTRQQIAALFELEQVLVGESHSNSAKKGQTATLVRVWGKHCSLLYLDRAVSGANVPTYGFTAQWGNRFAGVVFDRNIGLRGGQRVRVGESVCEVIAANELGYFIQNAVA